MGCIKTDDHFIVVYLEKGSGHMTRGGWIAPLLREKCRQQNK